MLYFCVFSIFFIVILSISYIFFIHPHHFSTVLPFFYLYLSDFLLYNALHFCRNAWHFSIFSECFLFFHQFSTCSYVYIEQYRFLYSRNVLHFAISGARMSYRAVFPALAFLSKEAF